MRGLATCLASCLSAFLHLRTKEAIFCKHGFYVEEGLGCGVGDKHLCVREDVAWALYHSREILLEAREILLEAE